MKKISLLSFTSAVWMTLIGLLAIYSASFSLSNLPVNPTLVERSSFPGTLVFALFGLVSCLAAGKQLRKPAPLWVAATIAGGILFFLVHMASTFLFVLPQIDIPVVADFLIEVMLRNTAIGIGVVVALYVLPLLYNLKLRRSPS